MLGGVARVGFNQNLRKAKSLWTYLHARYNTKFKIGFLISLIVIVLLWRLIFVTVPAGHVAVMWYLLGEGTDTSKIYKEGAHFKRPWDTMPIYDARVQQINYDYDVLTRDGVSMKTNIALRFRLNEGMVGELHKHIGPDYADKLLLPTVGSYARIIFSQNSIDDIYTTRRAAIQAEIREAVIGDMVHDFGQDLGQKAPWVIVQDVLVREMRFPPVIQEAVNRKIEQYQIEQEYGYRLKREELESRRKEVEARGIATFQNIVSSGISETYLRWKGIDATLALAQSPNTKVVVIGSGPQNLPLILGSEGGSPALEPSPGSSPQPAPAPARPTNPIATQSPNDPPR